MYEARVVACVSKYIYISSNNSRKLSLILPDFFVLFYLICFQLSRSDGEPRDLLDALLKGQTGGQGQKSSEPKDDELTDDHVLMTAAETFGAGVETTSTTLLWILAYLLHHPEVET